jgi:hypothetical protein
MAGMLYKGALLPAGIHQQQLLGARTVFIKDPHQHCLLFEFRYCVAPWLFTSATSAGNPSSALPQLACCCMAAVIIKPPYELIMISAETTLFCRDSVQT